MGQNLRAALTGLSVGQRLYRSLKILFCEEEQTRMILGRVDDQALLILRDTQFPAV